MMRALSMVSLSAGRILRLILASVILAAAFGVKPSAADEVLVISPQVFEYYKERKLDLRIQTVGAEQRDSRTHQSSSDVA